MFNTPQLFLFEFNGVSGPPFWDYLGNQHPLMAETNKYQYSELIKTFGLVKAVFEHVFEVDISRFWEGGPLPPFGEFFFNQRPVCFIR